MTCVTCSKMNITHCIVIICITGTMAWIHRQMMLGQNPRVILRDLISKDVEIDHMDDISLWEIIIHIMSEPPKRNRLEEYHTLDHAINLIKSCQKIVVLTGAGVFCFLSSIENLQYISCLSFRLYWPQFITFVTWNKSNYHNSRSAHVRIIPMII